MIINLTFCKIILLFLLLTVIPKSDQKKAEILKDAE